MLQPWQMFFQIERGLNITTRLLKPSSFEDVLLQALPPDEVWELINWPLLTSNTQAFQFVEAALAHSIGT